MLSLIRVHTQFTEEASILSAALLYCCIACRCKAIRPWRISRPCLRSGRHNTPATTVPAVQPRPTAHHRK